MGRIARCLLVLLIGIAGAAIPSYASADTAPAPEHSGAVDDPLVIAAAQALRAALPESFGGVWWEGPTIAVGTTDPDGLTVTLAAWLLGGRAFVVRAVEHSEATLLEARDQLHERMATDRNLHTLSVDIPENRIVVGVHPDGIASSTRTVLDQLATVVHERVEDAPAAAACNFSYCDAPLRGGVLMYTASGGTCSTGFNAVSKTDGKRYVLTAGHCVQYPAVWHTWQPRTGATHVIGDRHNHVFGTAGDFGLLKVDNPGVLGWNPKPWVYVRAWTGTPSTVRNESYVISAVGTSASIPNGELCRSGGASGTSCGRFGGGGNSVTLDMNDDGIGDVRVDDLGLITGAPLCKGDSGGPVYKSNKGFGLVSGGRTRFMDNGRVCYRDTWYQGLSEAASVMNVNVLLG